MLKAVIFDFDGVLADTEPIHYRAFLQAAQPLNIRFDYDQYLRDYVGFDDRDAYRAMLNHHGHAADETQVARLCREKGDAFAAIVAQGIESFPGMMDFIAARRAAGTPMAIASGATKADILPVLKQFSLTGLLDPIVTADDVARSKPDPQTYRLALQGLQAKYPNLGIESGDCMAIEDTAAGIEAARGAGLKVIGLTHTNSADVLGKAHRVLQTMQGVTWDQLCTWLD